MESHAIETLAFSALLMTPVLVSLFQNIKENRAR